MVIRENAIRVDVTVSIGTVKHAEFDSRDEPGTVLEEGSLPPQTNVHETCELHGEGKGAKC